MQPQHSKRHNKKKKECKNVVALFSGSPLGIQLCLPKNWTVDKERSSENEIFFNTGVPESHESIKITEPNQSLQDWSNSFDQDLVVNKSLHDVDDVKAIKLVTAEFGPIFIGFMKNDKLYVLTTGGALAEDDVLNSLLTSVVVIQ